MKKRVILPAVMLDKNNEDCDRLYIIPGEVFI